MLLRKIIFLSFALFALGAGAGAQPVSEPGEVRFIVLGDSQFSEVPTFDRLIHEVEMLRPQYVVQVGDMIHGYKYDQALLRDEWRRFKKQLEPLTAPFWPVPGNHDVVTDESEEIYGEVWGQDRYYYSFDYGPVHNVVLDTYYGEYDDVLPGFMLDWLRDDLEAYAAMNGGLGSEELESKSIFVYMHSPLWRYGEDTPGRQSWTEALDILEDYPVKLVVGGHTHEFVWQEERGIPHLVINSSGGMGASESMLGYLHGLLHVSVLDGGMRAAYIQAGSVFPIDSVGNAERRMAGRVRVGGQSIRIPGYVGGPLDHVVEVPVENTFTEERAFHLEWKFPRGSRVMAEPREMWLDVPPSQALTAKFRLRSATEPAAEAPSVKELPYLQASTKTIMRTGYVGREWEKRIREERAAAEGKDDVYTSSAYLEREIEFSANWPLFLPPIVVVPRIDEDMEIDGVMDEEAWGRAAAVTDFVYTDETEPEVGTEVRFLYDEDYLYVITVMEEPNPEGMVAAAQPPIALTWNDDDFELFLDPGMTQDKFYRFFENYRGTRFTSKPIGFDPRYIEDSPHRSAIVVGTDHWTLESAIPWVSLDRESAPEAGEQWGVFLWRHRPQGADPVITWNVGGGAAYSPERYGVLAFE